MEASVPEDGADIARLLAGLHALPLPGGARDCYHMDHKYRLSSKLDVFSRLKN
jgi:hypothetical protein